MDTLKVIDAYQNCKSIKKIAAELNLSEVKVRRILITAGLWRSKTIEIGLIGIVGYAAVLLNLSR